LPKGDPLVESFQRMQEELEGVDSIAVLLTLTSPPDELEERRGTLTEAADRLLRELDHPEIRHASYRVAEGLELPEELLVFWTLSPEDIGRLREIAEEVLDILPLLPEEGAPDLVTQVERLEDLPDPRTPGEVDELVSVLSRLVDSGWTGIDTLERLPEAQPLLHEAAQLVRIIRERPPPPEEGEPLFSRDSTRLVVQVTPRRPAHESMDYNKMMAHAVREAAERAAPEEWGVEADLTGSYVVAAEADEIIRQDMYLTTIISSVGVLVLLLFTFSSLFITGVALVPVLVSALFTMAWARLAVDGFNLVTAFLPALVLGYGIDFTVHLVARYSEERAAGRSVAQATATAIYRKGTASLTAALTTAAVFLSLLVSRAPAMAEMGIIMAVGTLIAYLAAMLVTPSLIVLAYVTFRRRFREVVPRGQPLFRRGYRHLLLQRRVVVSVFLLATLAMVHQASQVGFEFTSAELAPPTRSKEVGDEVVQEFDVELPLGDYFVFFVDSASQLSSLEQEVAERPHVVETQSARHLLPQELLRGRASVVDLPVEETHEALLGLRASLENLPAITSAAAEQVSALSQLELMAMLSGWGKQARELSAVSGEMITLLDALEELEPDELLPILSALDDDLGVVRAFAEGVEALPPEEELLGQLIELMPSELRSQYYTPRGRYVLRAQVSPEIYGTDELREFVSWAQGLEMDYFGLPEIQVHLESHMRRDFLLSTAIAALLIALLVWRSLKSFTEGLLALAPLVLGYVWMLAGMHLMDITFNFTNIVVSPLLIGIGVDSAVHILHRIEEEGAGGPGSVSRGASSSAVPVAATALATMLVFGALIAASTPGLQLLGTSALIGVGVALLGSLVFLPAASLWVERRRRGD
ncbi:MAG: MMPL family transporter, partial [Candidatus Bipolaricaulota bacterium]